MILSRRERLIALVTAAAVGILMLDRYALTPFEESRSGTLARKEAVLNELQRGRQLLANQRQLAPRWRAMLDGGLQGDPAEAEGQLLHACRNWAQESRLSLVSLTPDRGLETGDLREIAVRATLTGSMEGIRQFLGRVRGAAIPVRVDELLISARREGTDDLSLDMRLSTLYLASPALAGAAGPPGSATRPAERPAPPDLREYDILTQRNIFSRDRGRREPERPERERPTLPVVTPPAPQPELQLVLTGVLRVGDEWIASVEDRRTGVTLKLRPGEPAGTGHVRSVSMDGLIFDRDGNLIPVSVGQTLTGVAAGPARGGVSVAMPTGPAPVPAGFGAPAAGPAPSPPAASGATDGMSIEERLRLRRQQESR